MSPFRYPASAQAQHARLAKPAIAGVSLGLPHPPSRRRRIDRWGHFHGHARSRLTGGSTQPQPRPHHSSQFITDKHTSDDVSVNKSLFGNERETPSTRSPLTSALVAWRGSGAGGAWVELGAWRNSGSERAGGTRAEPGPDREGLGRSLGRTGKDSGGAGRDLGSGRGKIAEAVNNPSCSDIGARNRTRFANVSLRTDGATRGRPPGPGAIQ